ncbi:MAG: NERD domain-containing protein, partial [Thermoanaerobaculia bacterium]|nr:NERD domain-containing protein [Thermoanaerobaculia bacterium]
MATFIPPLDHVRDAPFSERKVLEALQALPDDWRVFSGVRFVVPPSGPHPATEREIDLLLLHPEHAMLAIEVKGGGVEYDARAMGGFFSTDRAGGRNRIENPFRQASSALHALEALVGRDGRWPDGSVDFARGHGVAFPDCDWEPRATPPDGPRELVLDRRDLAGGAVEERLVELSRFWAANRGQSV